MDRHKAALRPSLENILSPAGFTEYPQTINIFYSSCLGIPTGYGHQKGVLGSKVKCEAEGDTRASIIGCQRTLVSCCLPTMPSPPSPYL